jgi:hypothetical protein
MIESALRWSEYEELIQEVDNRILWQQLINVIRSTAWRLARQCLLSGPQISLPKEHSGDH